LRAAALRLRIQQRERACRLLEAAVRLFPESDSLRKLQSQSSRALAEHNAAKQEQAPCQVS
jgi:hypothetical protein